MRSFEAAEQDRQIGNMIRMGKVVEVNYATGQAKVQLEGDVTTGWLTMLTARAGGTKTWQPYEEGEQVAVFSPSGNLGNGVIMGAAFSEANPANGASGDVTRTDYADGSSVEHNAATGAMAIKATGAVTIEAPTITLKGDVNVVGKLTNNGTNVGDDHKHKDVTAGTAKTGEPE